MISFSRGFNIVLTGLDMDLKYFCEANALYYNRVLALSNGADADPKLSEMCSIANALDMDLSELIMIAEKPTRYYTYVQSDEDGFFDVDAALGIAHFVSFEADSFMEASGMANEQGINLFTERWPTVTIAGVTRLDGQRQYFHNKNGSISMKQS